MQGFHETKAFNVERIFRYLQSAGIFIPEDQDKIIACQFPHSLYRAINILNHAGILTRENFERILMTNNCQTLALSFTSLNSAGLLTAENRELFVGNEGSLGLATAIITLHRAGLLTAENKAIILQNPELSSILAVIFSMLQQERLLTNTNQEFVCGYANKSRLHRVFLVLQQARILTQENLNSLTHPIHEFLLTENALLYVWTRIPIGFLTQENFEQILIAARVENPLHSLRRLIDQINGVNTPPRVRVLEAINPRQSTHTASVHRSVSDSARNLMVSYGSELNLEEKILEIKAYVNGLEESLKNSAAKRCIERITAFNYHHLDIVSNVSTRQLIALAFIAIHDELKRQSSLEEAKALFIDALYEIQRGYNFGENGIDNQMQIDRPICLSGTFNKIIEKLNGIHVDVMVCFITHQTAYCKFPKIVQEQLLDYLRTLTTPKTALEYQQVYTLLENLKENGLDQIWDKIKSKVELIFWDEFKEAYANNQEHPLFREMIENGNYIQLPNLAEIKSQLAQSVGYQDYLYQLEKYNLAHERMMFSLYRQSLWANRHSSDIAQRAFDSKYGITLMPNCYGSRKK